MSRLSNFSRRFLIQVIPSRELLESTGCCPCRRNGGIFAFAVESTHGLSSRNWAQTAEAYRSKVDDSLGGHRASHEADELQLGAVLRDGSHGPVGDLDNGKAERRRFRVVARVRDRFIVIGKKIKNSCDYYFSRGSCCSL